MCFHICWSLGWLHSPPMDHLSIPPLGWLWCTHLCTLTCPIPGWLHPPLMNFWSSLWLYAPSTHDLPTWSYHRLYVPSSLASLAETILSLDASSSHAHPGVFLTPATHFLPDPPIAWLHLSPCTSCHNFPCAGWNLVHASLAGTL